MSILNPDHLLEQAGQLMEAPPAGPPRQVDVRRAISCAYCDVFHFVMTNVADEFVGAKHRATSRYALLYRSVDHGTLKSVCKDVSKQAPPPKYASYVPKGGFGQDLQAFAFAAVELQGQRHSADYDPRPRFKTAGALLAVTTARRAMRRFTIAPEDHRRTFLTLLLAPPRGA